MVIRAGIMLSTGPVDIIVDIVDNFLCVSKKNCGNCG
jgi:hypothetical protein